MRTLSFVLGCARIVRPRMRRCQDSVSKHRKRGNGVCTFAARCGTRLAGGARGQTQHVGNRRAVGQDRTASSPSAAIAETRTAARQQARGRRRHPHRRSREINSDDHVFDAHDELFPSDFASSIRRTAD